MTAPVELAGALPLPGVLVRVVAPPTTHQVTPIRPLGSPAARPPCRAQRPRGWVRVAVVWRLLQVDKMAAPRLPVGALGALQVEGDWPQQSAAEIRLHLLGASVATEERVADMPEVRESRPAGFESTRPRDAVTLAFLTEVVLHSLVGEQREKTHVEKTKPRLNLAHWEV